MFVTPAPIVPVVLAAGASSRMGRPKALLDFDGRSCLDLVLGACRDAGCARAVLVVGAASGAVCARALAGPIEVEIAINEHPDQGQSSSLRAGLRLLTPGAAAFLIFPVDHPLVRADDITRLCQAFAQRQTAQRIFIPSFGRRRGHPVLVDATLAQEFLALADGTSARPVIAAHENEIVHIEAASDRVLQDMDTPKDYQRCLDRFRSQG